MNANAESLDQSIDRYIDETQSKLPVPMHLGILIQSMKTGKVLYQYHANQLYAPASVQKLLVSTAALDYLKPTFQFQTRLLMSGHDLYVQFSGDPTLKAADINALFRSFYENGAHYINHVYVDNTDYNNVPYPGGWVWDDLIFSYAAPLNAAIIDENKFSMRFIPGKTGYRPKIETNLPKGLAKINNGLITIGRSTHQCPVNIYSTPNNHYTIDGCLFKPLGVQARSLAVRGVNEYVVRLVERALTENKIQYIGAVTISQRPQNFQVIATHQSEPLRNIIKHMLKKSDNLMTDSVFKKLGQIYFGEQGSWENGSKAVQALLQQNANVDFSRAIYVDGAGLSRYNLMSPIELSQVLNYAYRNDNIRDDLFNSLPIAGVDGTLEYQMKSVPDSYRVHAKTGTMTGVSCLAGYVNTKDQGLVSFVIMANGIVGGRQHIHHLDAQICKKLIG